jgi:hypothetical protein
MLPYPATRLDGDCSHSQIPGTAALSVCVMVPAERAARSRPSMTSMAMGSGRCDAPAALPVTTMRSRTIGASVSSGASDRGGASTT